MVEGSDDIGWVLWAATVGLDSPLVARVDAASTVGFTRVSVSPSDVARAEAEGTPIAELARFIHDAGLEVVLDPVMSWHGGPLPEQLAAFDIDTVLGMVEALGAVSVSVLGPFAWDEPIEALAEPFAAFCDRLADTAARAHLEPMPMTAVGDLDAAWAIVGGADRDNGGILLDSWHFFRSGADFEALQRVPAERIFAVQLADGGAELHGGTLGEDTFHRLQPGEGVFDLHRLVQVLSERGALGWVGPEVLSPDTEAMGPVEAARHCAERARALVDQARAPHGAR